MYISYLSVFYLLGILSEMMKMISCVTVGL